MADFIKLTSQASLPALNEAGEYVCGGKSICIANVNGSYHAMDNVCPHRGGPLHQGMIEKSKLVCPWHAWAWDPVTGEEARKPDVKVRIYPLKIENGDVFIDLSG